MFSVPESRETLPSQISQPSELEKKPGMGKVPQNPREGRFSRSYPSKEPVLQLETCTAGITMRKPDALIEPVQL